MSAIPTLNIPVTVTTDQVPRALSKVERDVTSSAKRLQSRMSSIGQNAPGVLKALGINAPGVGALGRLGIGGGGLALGAAPFVAARGLMSAFESATAGATDALQKFRDTGENSFGANSKMLQALSQGERWVQANKTMGLGQAFEGAMVGTAGGEEPILKFYTRTLSDFAVQASAFLGSIAGGGTTAQAMAQAQLSTAPEWAIPQAQAQMRLANATTSEQSSFMSAPISYATEAFIENSKILQWMIAKSI